MEYNVTTTVHITHEMIALLMTTAIEGGITSWADKVMLVSGKDKVKDFDGMWYDNADLYALDDFVIEVTEDDGNKHVITPEVIAEGLRLMASDFVKSFRDVYDDNVDADTADLFVQLCIFKELRYS